MVARIINTIAGVFRPRPFSSLEAYRKAHPTLVTKGQLTCWECEGKKQRHWKQKERVLVRCTRCNKILYAEKTAP